MSEKSIVLLSGGLDSMVLAHDLKARGQSPRFLHINFGLYSSLQELETARRTAFALNSPIETVNLSGLGDSLVGHVPIGMLHELDILDPRPAKTFDPMPNFVPTGFPIVLTVGSYFAQLTGYNRLHVAAIESQFKGLPALKEFFSHWSKGMGMINPANPDLKIMTPFMDKTKADVVLLGSQLKVPMEQSWSCVTKERLHCGKCVGCTERKEAFAIAKQQDLTTYSVQASDPESELRAERTSNRQLIDTLHRLGQIVPAGSRSNHGSA